MDLKTCTMCGEKCPDEYQFCIVCGSRLEKERTHAGETGPGPRKVTKREVEEVRTPAIKKARAETNFLRTIAASAPRERARPPWEMNVIAVDGSNALYGGGTSDTPKVRNLKLVIEKLKEAGYKPVVFVDASRKYDVDNRNAYFQMRRVDKLREVPAGSPADCWILQYATRTGCKVISNDRFQNWAEKFPIVEKQERFVRFMVNDDGVDFWTAEGEFLPRKISPPSRRAPRRTPSTRLPEVPDLSFLPRFPAPPARPRGLFASELFPLAVFGGLAVVLWFFFFEGLGALGVPIALALAGTAACIPGDLTAKRMPVGVMAALMAAAVLFYALTGRGWDHQLLGAAGLLYAFFCTVFIGGGFIALAQGMCGCPLEFGMHDVYLFTGIGALLMAFTPPVAFLGMQVTPYPTVLVTLIVNVFFFAVPIAAVVYAVFAGRGTKPRKVLKNLAGHMRSRASRHLAYAPIAAGLTWGAVFGLAPHLRPHLDWLWWNVVVVAVLLGLWGAAKLGKRYGYAYWGTIALFVAGIASPGMFSGAVTLGCFIALYLFATREVILACDAAVPNASIVRGGFPMAPAFLAGLVLTLLVGDLLTIAARGLWPGLLAFIGA